MPKIKPANPGQLRVRIKWYVSRKSNFLALSLTNSNCPYRTRLWRGLLLITDQIREACDNAPFSARLHKTRCAWKRCNGRRSQLLRSHPDGRTSSTRSVPTKAVGGGSATSQLS